MNSLLVKGDLKSPLLKNEESSSEWPKFPGFLLNLESWEVKKNQREFPGNASKCPSFESI